MDVTPFSLPLVEPLVTAGGTIECREGFLVGAERDGIRGVGEATPLPGWTESFADCASALQAVADGARDPTNLDPAATPAAKHAVDLTRADRRARERGVPLSGLLAEDPRESIAVNATIGDGTPAETADAAREVVEDGFACLKVKVGARPVAADVDRLRAIGETVGDVALRVDANGAWSRSQARAAIDELAALGVTLVEQPLPATDLSGHAALRGRGVDVAVDESLREAGIDAILEAEAADGVILKPMVVGGIERARDVARRARDAGVFPIVTTTIDGVVARTAALHLAAALGIERACGLATADRLADDLAPDPAPVADGRMDVPEGPGIGVRIRE